MAEEVVSSTVKGVERPGWPGVYDVYRRTIYRETEENTMEDTTATTLSGDALVRAEALRTATEVLKTTNVFGQSRPSVLDLLLVTEFIVTGDTESLNRGTPDDVSERLSGVESDLAAVLGLLRLAVPRAEDLVVLDKVDAEVVANMLDSAHKDDLWVDGMDRLREVEDRLGDVLGRRVGPE